jgi:hypothetical protein
MLSGFSLKYKVRKYKTPYDLKGYTEEPCNKASAKKGIPFLIPISDYF